MSSGLNHSKLPLNASIAERIERAPQKASTKHDMHFRQLA